MSSQDDLSHCRVDESVSIPRSASVVNLASLTCDGLRQSHIGKDRSSESPSADQSEHYSSENSQVVYLPKRSKKSRKLRSSLSSVGNLASRVMDGSPDNNAYVEEQSENFAWNVIDREIFEWQYVCHTGRPYWWSPESKYSRLKKPTGRLSYEPHLQAWMPEVVQHPKEFYEKQRRSVSDSFLAGQDDVDDLAQLVAIQLLGSCFTLSPNQYGLPSPDFSSCNSQRPQSLADPRLISSLRMHTSYRYSPSFGHQARNTSPVHDWYGSSDGPSTPSSPPYLATGFSTPVIGTSGSPSRRRRAYRPLNVTEGSTNRWIEDNKQEKHVKKEQLDNLDSTSSVLAHRHQRTDNVNSCPKTRPYLSYHSSYRESQCSKPSENHWDNDMPDNYRGVKSGSRSRLPTTNYRLQPVIRSEPHPVFVQPVKELVVKRWKTMRRRFGGSLHSPLPTDPTEFASQLSSPVRSDASSPTISSDARTRRQRAQERGDIHSSADSTPHYNSPASGYGTPNGNDYDSPFWVDSATASPNLQHADSGSAADTLATMESDRLLFTSTSNSSKPSRSLARNETISAATPQSTPELRPQHRVAPSSSSQTYTNRIRQRQHRKSMLSEMHTPENLAEDGAGEEVDPEYMDRSVLSAAGSLLATPKEEIESPESCMKPAIRSATCEIMDNAGPGEAFSTRRMTISAETQASPRLSKTSTTGTQVFTPGDDGVEIDGLPAGPSKDLWWGRSCK